MREILFKAKRIDNGEWVEGDLVHSVYKINDVCVGKYGSEVGMHQVDTSSICQCTGLKDKNGQKIWENDILEWTREDIALVSSPYHEGYRLGDRVKVKNLDSGFTLLALKNNSEVPNVIGNVKNYEFWNMQRFLKVIGNIFDNPELLKGGAEE